MAKGMSLALVLENKTHQPTCCFSIVFVTVIVQLIAYFQPNLKFAATASTEIPCMCLIVNECFLDGVTNLLL